MPDTKMPTRLPKLFEPKDELSGPVTSWRPGQRGRTVHDAGLESIELILHQSLPAIEEEWLAFEKEADYTPFQSYHWLSAWHRHIGELQRSRPAIVFGRRSEGQLLFILPLSVEPSGLIRRLTWLGSQLSDYNAPLLSRDFRRVVGPEHFQRLWHDVVKFIRRAPGLRFDLVDLRKMPETVGIQRNPCLGLDVKPNASSMHMASLEPDWDRFYGRRSKSTRSRDRTKFRRLQEFGEIKLVEPQSAEEIADTLRIVFTQKARSFARMGVGNLFARPGYEDFFVDVATNPAMRDRVHVSQLRVGSEIAAANLGLSLNGCYYYVLSSYDDGETARYGPGAIHLRALMKRAIERNFYFFDFTIGDEAYKRDWCDHHAPLHDHLAAVGFRAVPALISNKTLLGAKRYIKQNPALWSAFTRLRAFVAALRPTAPSQS